HALNSAPGELMCVTKSLLSGAIASQRRLLPAWRPHLRHLWMVLRPLLTRTALLAHGSYSCQIWNEPSRIPIGERRVSSYTVCAVRELVSNQRADRLGLDSSRAPEDLGTCFVPRSSVHLRA